MPTPSTSSVIWYLESIDGPVASTVAICHKHTAGHGNFQQMTTTYNTRVNGQDYANSTITFNNNKKIAFNNNKKIAQLVGEATTTMEDFAADLKGCMKKEKEKRKKKERNKRNGQKACWSAEQMPKSNFKSTAQLDVALYKEQTYRGSLHSRLFLCLLQNGVKQHQRSAQTRASLHRRVHSRAHAHERTHAVRRAVN